MSLKLFQNFPNFSMVLSLCEVKTSILPYMIINPMIQLVSLTPHLFSFYVIFRPIFLPWKTDAIFQLLKDPQIITWEPPFYLNTIPALHDLISFFCPYHLSYCISVQRYNPQLLSASHIVCSSFISVAVTKYPDKR